MNSKVVKAIKAALSDIEYDRCILFGSQVRGNAAKNERYLKKDNFVTDGICFHCQQTVEKYLKAFFS